MMAAPAGWQRKTSAASGNENSRGANMKRFCVVVLFICVLVATGFGQSNTGSLTGTVSDAAGVVPNATVTLTDNRTGRERSTQTSGEGSFSFTLLDVGLYTVK